jgi:signal peptidase I
LLPAPFFVFSRIFLPRSVSTGSGFTGETMSNYVASEEAPIAEAPPVSEPKRSGAIREVIETLILAAIIFFGVRQLVLNFQVDGHSMDPNLDNGEMLLVNRHAYETWNLASLINWLPFVDIEPIDVTPFGGVERGDIVVFDPPNDDKPYIKRIIGLPGDEISFRDGSVFVNGVQVNEAHITEETNCPTSACREAIVVPEGHVYVLGDNRNSSEDSRYFGPVKIDAIIGKAIFTYWPIGDVGRVPHYTYDVPSATEAAGTD